MLARTLQRSTRPQPPLTLSVHVRAGIAARAGVRAVLPCERAIDAARARDQSHSRCGSPLFSSSSRRFAVSPALRRSRTRSRPRQLSSACRFSSGGRTIPHLAWLHAPSPPRRRQWVRRTCWMRWLCALCSLQRSLHVSPLLCERAAAFSRTLRCCLPTWMRTLRRHNRTLRRHNRTPQRHDSNPKFSLDILQAA